MVMLTRKRRAEYSESPQPRQLKRLERGLLQSVEKR